MSDENRQLDNFDFQNILETGFDIKISKWDHHISVINTLNKYHSIRVRI